MEQRAAVPTNSVTTADIVLLLLSVWDVIVVLIAYVLFEYSVSDNKLFVLNDKWWRDDKLVVTQRGENLRRIKYY